jgi:thiol-disulfide isomerase/thioredoxin
MIRILATIIFILVISNLKAQRHYYIEYGKCRVLTEYEYQNKKSIAAHKAAKLPGKIKLQEEIIKTEESQDSIINTFKFSLRFGRGGTMTLTTEPEAIYKLRGKPMPEFTIQDTSGNSISLASLKGKPVLINLWFNGCKPCIREIPVLNKIKEEIKDNAHFIAITFNNKKEIEAILKKHPYNYTQLINAKAYIDTLGFKSYPKLILLNKHGIITQIFDGVDYIYDDVDKKVVIGNGGEVIREIKYLLEYNDDVVHHQY